MTDIGLTHIALPVVDVERSIKFYSTYANMEVIHSRVDAQTGSKVVWISDRTRPFVVVLIETNSVHPVLSPFAHLGVGCKSRQEIDLLCEKAQEEDILIQAPQDSGYPIGYWALLRDPDGHTLELAYGQEIELTLEQYE